MDCKINNCILTPFIETKMFYKIIVPGFILSGWHYTIDINGYTMDKKYFIIFSLVFKCIGNSLLYIP